MNKNNLHKLISGTREKYEKIGSVWCPILKTNVHFSSEGRIHLLYKGNRKKRPVKEQFYKLKLFPSVVPVIKTATEIKSIRLSKNNKIRYYAIVGIVNKKKIRVIIKKTNNGNFNYHSVMLDKTNKPQIGAHLYLFPA